jgi:AraC-like DNA-binding protein
MEESFEYYFESHGMHLKYARSFPAVSGREFHDYYELVVFLGGRVRFISAEIQQDLDVGNVVIIPQGCFHQFIVDGNDYTRCIFGFYKTDELEQLVSSALTEVKIIEKPSGITEHLIECLIEAAKWDIPTNEKALYLRSAAVMLLTELKKTSKGIVTKNLNISQTVHDAIRIIDGSYAEPLTVEDIAKKLCISSSLLSHKFKKDLNVSVYKYITKKRLSVARQLIHSGVPTTFASVKCGFSDYSCFLRAYKKEYSQNPSEA